MASDEDVPTPPVGLPEHVHGAFGRDTFGRRAESFARSFGTPRFLVGQTVIVGVWIVLNATAVIQRWDPYPFILLNLMFSLQAAYAAPLILLAQTRQADRDKQLSLADTAHREVLARVALDQQTATLRQTATIEELLRTNTALTEEVRDLALRLDRRDDVAD
jgi:uncharacterized membrane protein